MSLQFSSPLFSVTKGDVRYAMEIENYADLCNIVLRRVDRQNEFHTKADELQNSKGESKSGLSDTCNFNKSKSFNRLSMRDCRLRIRSKEIMLGKIFYGTSM